MKRNHRSIVARSRIQATLAGVLVLLTLTACSTTDSGSGASGQPGVSAADVASLKQLVADAEKTPPFVAPGPAFDTSKLAGKRIFIMPTVSVGACDQISKDLVDLAGRFGMKGTYFESTGGAAAWIPGMQQAVSQKYDAIILVCAIDPNLIKPQVEAATAAGIPVILSSGDDTVNGAKQNPLVSAQTNVPSAEAIRRAVDVALIENASEPFDAFMITSNDVPPAIPMAEAVRDEFAKYCPACKLTEANVAVPDWATKTQSEVATALVANPRIKAIVPLFDGPSAAQAAAAVSASGRTDVKLYGNYGGTPEYIEQMGAGTLPMATDTGPSHLWRAYSTMDQALRLLAGVDPLPADKAGDPNRLFTKNNYKEISGPNDGFGTEFQTGYEELWGLK